jgi:hypothetical protein
MDDAGTAFIPRMCSRESARFFSFLALFSSLPSRPDRTQWGAGHTFDLILEVHDSIPDTIDPFHVLPIFLEEVPNAGHAIGTRPFPIS